MIINFNNTQLDILLKDDSYRYRAIRGENALTLRFDSTDFIDIPVGAWTEYMGNRYELMSPENFKKNGTRKFEYTLIMESEQSRLKKYKFKDVTTKKLKFSLTDTPQMHIKFLVDNMNMRETGWAIGETIEAVEQVINYNHTNCFEALNMIADAFNTEWEIVGKTIHLRKVEYNKDNPLPLSYGKGNGFVPGVGRMNADDSNPVEILYTQGGTRNIDRSKYGSEFLLLPKGRQFEYEGRKYVADEEGYSICRADKALTTKVEDSLDCSHIYPSRVGTISEVLVIDAPTEDDPLNAFYDFKDSSIPDDLDYSKCQIKGEKATIIFQTGMLAGKEFDIETDAKGVLTGYDHDERRFKLVQQEIDGMKMPNEAFSPKVGGKYAVFGISMPDSYVCDNSTQSGAEWDMFKEGAKYLYEHEDPRFTFTGELDGIWAKKNWIEIGGKIKLGGYVLFSDNQFLTEGILIRMTGVKEFINDPHSPTIELSNVSVGASFSSELKKIDSNEVLNEQKLISLQNFTKRRYTDAKEAQEMLEQALEHFSPGIDPIWVRTMSVLIGNEYQQFEFVNRKTEPQSEVLPHFNMDNPTKIFTAPASILKHMTMGIENTSSNHDVSKYKYWDVTEYTSPYLDSPDTPYYLVAQCAKSGTTGSFFLKEKYTYDPGDGYWYFLVGLLSSEKEGERSFATCYGFTEILPGQMRIKLIISPDGKTYFNVSEGEIGGNIRIVSATGYKNILDKPDLTVYATKSEFSVLGDRITANVQGLTYVNGRLTTIENAGFITTAQGNTLYASKTMENGATIISKINQTPYNVVIDANHIDLYGAVTYNMLNPSLKTELDAKLESGEISLSDLNATLQYKINTMSSDIASKINASALKAFAKTGGPGLSKSDFQSALQTEFNAKLTGSAKASGNKLTDVIVNGQTLIYGGYIQAQYINVDNLTVNKAAQIGIFTANLSKLIGVEQNCSVEMSPFLIAFDHPVSGRSMLDGTSGRLYLQKKQLFTHAQYYFANSFLQCISGSGSSERNIELLLANTPAENNTWYFRTMLRMSHMPFWAHLSTFPTVVNSTSNNTYALRWCARTGIIFAD